ncbi:tight adherence protein C [Mariprofundus ferrinatatus]|uniref:Tight adherence protein C n=1 Tax=Mariprofundus ferrinatatus TaxID=1921087 RepID=A0A2K8L360_9PROT|nr:type II secretion system F family protein [Mariprofundus ferrinatatus]ATX81768.1 tight adherence protein C [Mariprofundus ferrinatatus]
MKELIAVISSFLSTDNQIAILGMVFLATALLFYGIFIWLMGGMSPVQRRLNAIEHPEEAIKEDLQQRDGRFFVRIAESAASVVIPDEAWTDSNLKMRLVKAGYYSPRAIRVFIGNKVFLGILVPVAIIIIAVFSGYSPAAGNLYVIFLVVLAAVLGYNIPNFILINKINKRRLSFSESFPDAMDMFVVCVEAGLGLDAAIQRVSEELRHSHPVLAGEFAVLSLELRSGKTREEALRSLAERTGLDEVSELVTLLVQADHFGTSVADALRTHAKEMRTMRMQRAREKAAKLPVKMIFPIILFIFPALFLVILGPAIIRIYEGFIKGLGG